MQVLDLCSTIVRFNSFVSFGHPFALTCVDFDRAQIRTQVDKSIASCAAVFSVAPTISPLKTAAQEANKSTAYAW